MHKYIDGAIIEAIAKARKLKEKIPGASKLNIYFSPLVTTANHETDIIINDLINLFQDRDYGKPESLKQKFLQYKKKVGNLTFLENVVIAAISRSHIDDEYANKLVEQICKEINYPIQKPVVSCLSQKYYHIYSNYNLLCIPLLESDFLLHIPDIYHELSHPLLALDNPKLENFQYQLGFFNKQVLGIFDEEIERRERNAMNEAKMIDFLYIWRDSWIQKWSMEIFCDLFGIYTLGPAYAWSNIHLCIKLSHNVYDIPYIAISTHPPDDARMNCMFQALELMGYKKEKDEIRGKWNKFIDLFNYQKRAEYSMAVPEILIESASVFAFEGVKQLGCNIATFNDNDIIKPLLNDAWKVFWSDPNSFVSWEISSVEKLKRTL